MSSAALRDPPRKAAYLAWRNARYRCQNPANPSFRHYGARGIKVCPEWGSFDAFWHDMGPSWRTGLTLERVEVAGDYSPTNCRWATPKEQARNRRNNVRVMTPWGEMTIAEAAERAGVNRSTMWDRLRRRGSVAPFSPARKYTKHDLRKRA